ncbi:lipase chaperone [Phreatobacter aquaticus]|uniref:Lipase chaperone n=1 Tax=Phreatobacter aquaticus TaxID=2570229 RepID=A0A4D7QLM2_9HYPH|nr:lipase chaperone [Phreatobacter aquaticus]QCK87451.1 lipase chaperone [Phreatobacter aquaticus]
MNTECLPAAAVRTHVPDDFYVALVVTSPAHLFILPESPATIPPDANDCREVRWFRSADPFALTFGCSERGWHFGEHVVSVIAGDVELPAGDLPPANALPLLTESDLAPFADSARLEAEAATAIERAKIAAERAAIEGDASLSYDDMRAALFAFDLTTADRIELAARRAAQAFCADHRDPAVIEAELKAAAEVERDYRRQMAAERGVTAADRAEAERCQRQLAEAIATAEANTNLSNDKRQCAIRAARLDYDVTAEDVAAERQFDEDRKAGIAEAIKAEAEAEAAEAERIEAAAQAWLDYKDKEAAAATPVPAPAPAAPPAADPYAALYDVPGLVGAITRYICDTALQPMPLHALGAALVAIGTAAGRRYRGPTKCSCVLYVANIAESGTGKEHPMDTAKVIMRKAGLGQHIGPGEFASGEAFMKTVTKQPLGFSAVDEFGSVWSDMNNQRMPWMGKIARYMRTQWGKNFGSLETTAKALDASVTIIAPHFSIIGASTPKQFWHSLRGSNVEDGTLNRMLVLTAEPGKHDPSHKPCDEGVPDRIVTLLKAIYGDQMYPDRNDRESLGHVIDIPFGDGAEDYWTRMRDGFATRAANPAIGLFFRRAAEMSLRVAQIRAIGINPLQPVITVADLEWGSWIVGLSTTAMASNGVDFIADSEHQANLKEVRRIIRKAGGTMTRTKLVRALDGTMKARDLDDAVRLLIDGGEVAEETVKPGEQGGRPGKVYKLNKTA